MKRATTRRRSGIKVDSRGGLVVRVSARRMAQLDAADAKAAVAREEKESAFTVMDAVMQARTDLEGTLAVNAAILGADLDEAAVLTMERHIEADWQKLCATLDAAWERFVSGRR